jgi:hypothetical protein
MPHYTVILHALHSLILSFTITNVNSNKQTVVEVLNNFVNNIYLFLSFLGVVFLMCIFVKCICLVCIVMLCVFVILCICVFVVLAVLL